MLILSNGDLSTYIDPLFKLQFKINATLRVRADIEHLSFDTIFFLKKKKRNKEREKETCYEREIFLGLIKSHCTLTIRYTNIIGYKFQFGPHQKYQAASLQHTTGF